MEDKEFLITFKSFVYLHYKRHKKVSFYAEKMNLSVHLLNKNLNRIEGRNAKEIINFVVLKKAKEKLKNSNDTIKEVAFALGFIDPTYFFKFFSRYVEDTPSGFREKIREKMPING